MAVEAKRSLLGGKKGNAAVFLKEINVEDCTDSSECSDHGREPPLMAADLCSPEPEVTNTVFRLLHPPCWLSK